MEGSSILRKKENYFGTGLCIAFVLISFIVAIVLICDADKPYYYNWLFLMPLVYGLSSLICNRIYQYIPQNIGIMLVVGLLFIRMVISPLLLSLGSYSVTIEKNIEENTFGAIMLVCYESVCIFFTLWYCSQKRKRRSNSLKGTLVSRGFRISSKYYFWISVFTLMLLLCIFYTPELITKGYRNVFQIGEKGFTAYEDSQLVDEFGTTFAKKLSLVSGTYLMRIALYLLPAFGIIVCARSKRRLVHGISFGFTLVPFFFIGGTVANSLIYFVELTMMCIILYSGKKLDKRMITIFAFAVCAILAWWIIRSPDGQEMGESLESFSRRFSSYFSGVNVVSGVFNMERSLVYRFRYFMYDIFGTIPFSTTLFGISNVKIQTFFNSYNDSQGQIVPTIAMGYYYFGYILSPIYSIIFATVAYKVGRRIRDDGIHPIRLMRYLMLVFQMSMGIVMYNVEITMTVMWGRQLPLYLLEKLGRVKDKDNFGELL